jgi:hypothetical protein
MEPFTSENYKERALAEYATLNTTLFKEDDPARRSVVMTDRWKMYARVPQGADAPAKHDTLDGVARAAAYTLIHHKINPASADFRVDSRLVDDATEFSFEVYPLHHVPRARL